MGIALSPYIAGEGYASTEQRSGVLWIELKQPVENKAGDALFARMIVPHDSDETQLEQATDSNVRFLLPLPPGIEADDPELFGFWSYDLAHRLRRRLVVHRTGALRPAAPGQRRAAPRAASPLPRRTRDRTGYSVFATADVEQFLFMLGLPKNSPLSVLAVELLPGGVGADLPSNTPGGARFPKAAAPPDDPLGIELEYPAGFTDGARRGCMLIAACRRAPLPRASPACGKGRTGSGPTIVPLPPAPHPVRGSTVPKGCGRLYRSWVSSRRRRSVL